jgi:hypothetical protein
MKRKGCVKKEVVAYPSICQQFPKPWKVETPGKRERGSVVD